MSLSLQVQPNGAKHAPRKLDSWKEIASYLGREVRTVQRWEKTNGLPVRRLYHEQRGSVYAFTEELDRWVASREPGILASPGVDQPAPGPLRIRAGFGAVAICAAALAVVLIAQRVASQPQAAASRSAAMIAMSPAREAYLRGLYFLQLQTREGLDKSIAEFTSALGADPKLAAAAAGIAEAHTYLSSGVEYVANVKAAREFSVRALHIDAKSAEAHESAAAIALYVDWNWPLADAEYKQALALDPDLASAHNNYAQLAAIMGRENVAVAEAQRAWQLQPLSPTYGASLGWFYYWARDYDRAIATSRQVLQSQPGFYSAQQCVIRALVKQGKLAEARSEVIQRMKERSIDYRAAGLEAESPELAINNYYQWRLERLRETEKTGQYPAFDLALTLAALGDRDGFIECMQKSFAQRKFIALLIYVEPFFDRYRDEPKLVELAQKIGLPQATATPNTVASLR